MRKTGGGIGQNGKNQGGVGEIWLPSASADVRGRRGMCGRRKEDGISEIMRKKRKMALNGRNQGGAGEIFAPSASVSFHQLQRTSVDIRDMFGRKAEDGGCGIMRKNMGAGEIGLNERNQGGVGEILIP